MAANARQSALQVLMRVINQGMNLQQALADCPEGRDKALVQALSYGVLRWYFRLDFLTGSLIKKPLRDKDRDIHLLALLGVFQLGYSPIKSHAAISETVAAVGKKQWAKGFLNALLRNYQRDKENLESLADQTPAACYAHPEWMVDLINADWGEEAVHVFEQNNQQAPMTIRVNQLQAKREDYMGLLSNNQILANPVLGVESALSLEKAVDVTQLPGFSKGVCSVQDAAAQLAAFILNAAPGDRVLDLCAAPGGKTVHILENQPALAKLVAVDVEAQRLSRVQENLERVGVAAEVKCGDAAEPTQWWDGELFDKILLDAPCSASGVIRRHPDIKWLRRQDDLKELVNIQQKILDVAWSLLVPGGSLLYATCSVFKQENELQIQEFLQAHSDARLIDITLPVGRTSSFGHQILPGEGGMDGFFYAYLGKQA